MTKAKWSINRRDFLKAGSCAALGSLFGPGPAAAEKSAVAAKSRVVLVRSEQALDETGQPDAAVLGRMLDQAVASLFRAQDPREGWRKVAGPADTVGVKSNRWASLPTPPALEAVIRQRLLSAGVQDANLSIDDWGVQRDPVFLRATALVNVRPMRTHHWSGLGTCLKNYIMFSPNPPQYHPNACENLGALWSLPLVKGKTRLNILVMLTPQFHGVGPHSFSKAYVWPYGGLIAGVDPVAVDTVGAHIIQAKRKLHFGRDNPISPPPRHIAAADTKFGLGNSRLENIELIRLGWSGDILI